MGSSFEKILHPEEVGVSALTYLVLIVSIAVKLWQGMFNRNLGKRISSEALQATAADSLNDVFSTGAGAAEHVGLPVHRHPHRRLVGMLVAIFITVSASNSSWKPAARCWARHLTRRWSRSWRKRSPPTTGSSASTTCRYTTTVRPRLCHRPRRGARQPRHSGQPRHHRQHRAGGRPRDEPQPGHPHGPGWSPTTSG